MRKLLVTILLAAATLAAADQTDSFRLSMPKIKATVAAMKGLAEVLSADALLRARFMAAKKQLPDTNGRDSVSMAAEALSAREPKIAAVYRQSAITPKEAGMTMETLVGTALGAAMLEASGKKDAKLPEGFVAENVEFYKAHKGEIMQALGELQSLKGKLPEDEEDSDEDEK
jgi:hypothetical protein